MVSCQLTLQMAEEIAFENDQLSNFEGLVTLTLDRVILHTVLHHSRTSTYMPNLIEIKETFGGQTDVLCQSRPKSDHREAGHADYRTGHKG